MGLSVSAAAVQGVVVEHGHVVWAGEAAYAGPSDLADVLARLAGERTAKAHQARLVLGSDVVQLRTIVPAPPLSASAGRRYVALEAARLFRKNGAALVTDAAIVKVDAHATVLRAAAAPAPLVEAAAAGCAQAGISLDAVGPAADVLPRAVRSGVVGDIALPSGEAIELISIGPTGVWRSRHLSGATASRVAWAAGLEPLGDSAARYAAAFAATQVRPRLDLLPPSVAEARSRSRRQRRARLALVGAALWLMGGMIYGARAAALARSQGRELAASAPRVDSALAMRRDLAAATATLGVIAAAKATRSRHLDLMAALTAALGDSVYLVALRVEPDGTVRLAGYAPSAAAVVARLARVPELRGPALEGPVTRESPAGRGELDRFAIVARRAAGP